MWIGFEKMAILASGHSPGSPSSAFTAISRGPGTPSTGAPLARGRGGRRRLCSRAGAATSSSVSTICIVVISPMHVEPFAAASTRRLRGMRRNRDRMRHDRVVAMLRYRLGDRCRICMVGRSNARPRRSARYRSGRRRGRAGRGTSGPSPVAECIEQFLCPGHGAGQAVADADGHRAAGRPRPSCTTSKMRGREWRPRRPRSGQGAVPRRVQRQGGAPRGGHGDPGSGADIPRSANRGGAAFPPAAR